MLEEEGRAVTVAKAFFAATTKLSSNSEDILPQEDGVGERLSVFCLFSELFPEFATDKDRTDGAGKNGLMRLQFNKIGYEIYEKEQSRRVPAVRAKPGNPGYGFRRARWRETMQPGEDLETCERIMRSLGVNEERLLRIKQRVHAFKVDWDAVRRPSRPAGPGRPRGHKRAPEMAEPVCAAPAYPGCLGAAQHMELGNLTPTKKTKKIPSKQTAAKAADAASSPWTTPVAALVVDDRAPAGEQRPLVAAATMQPMQQHMQPQQAPPPAYKAAAVEEENQSLRSLNSSLLSERNELLSHLGDLDADLRGLHQRLLEGVGRLGPGQGDLSAAFHTMAMRFLAPEGASASKFALTPEQHAALDRAVTSYDEASRSQPRAAAPVRHAASTLVGAAASHAALRGEHAEQQQHRPVGGEAADEEGHALSCEELRAVLLDATYREDPADSSILAWRSEGVGAPPPAWGPGAAQGGAQHPLQAHGAEEGSGPASVCWDSDVTQLSTPEEREGEHPPIDACGDALGGCDWLYPRAGAATVF